jgi:hypothetical protein
MEVSWAPRIEVTHFGALCRQVMRRSDRSWEVLVWVPMSFMMLRDVSNALRMKVTYNASCWVHSPTQCVDSDNVWCLLIPGSILSPIAC